MRRPEGLVGTICGALLALIPLWSCDREAGVVSARSFHFSGVMKMKVAGCTVVNPPKAWNTTFTTSPGPAADQVLVTEEAYGCTFVTTRRGRVLDGSGASCPVKVGGFSRQDFLSFRWDLGAGKVEYSSKLVGHGAQGQELTYCADVSGVL